MLYAVPYVVIQIQAGGILSQRMFADTPHAFEGGAAALALITVVYIAIGGMRSEAWTDVVQGSLLGGDSLSNLLSDVKKMMDTSAWGLLANTATMALVSMLGKNLPKATPVTPAG